MNRILVLVAVTITCASVTFVHFSLVLISSLPLNPLAIELRPEIAAYVGPFFAQNWALFGPTPPESDSTLLAQYRIRDGITTRITDWYDISGALRREIERNPVAPLAAVYTVSNSVMFDLENTRVPKRRSDFVSDTPTSPESADRLAVSYAKDLKLDGTVTAVRVKILTRRYPRFSHRSEPDTVTVSRDELSYPWSQEIDVPRMSQLAF